MEGEVVMIYEIWIEVCVFKVSCLFLLIGFFLCSFKGLIVYRDFVDDCIKLNG